LEHAGRGRLGSLRGAKLGHVGDRQDESLGILWSRLFNAGARGRLVRRHSGSQKSKDECQRLGLRFYLVLSRPSGLTLINPGGNERQSLATGSGWLGNRLQQLLEVLVGSECAGRGLSLAARFAASALLATGIAGVPPAMSAEREQFDHSTMGGNITRRAGRPRSQY
jgi:hypothetical protein